VSQLVRSPVGSAADEVVVVSGHVLVLRESVLAVAEAGDDAPAHVRLLGTERALAEACDDFLTATRAAEMVDEGRLTMRASDEHHLPSLLVTAGAVTTVSALPGGDAVAVRTDDDDPVFTIRSAFVDAFSDATPFEVTVPGYSRLLDSLDSAVGSDVRDDVAAVLEAGVSVRSSDATLDEIDTILLMGGRNGAQLYELSEWAEELGVASRATMSSRKRQLEAAGLLTTEKIHADVGRPRQRLLVAADRLREASPVDLVRAARSVLVDE
jgi:hypothetical protein